MFDSRPRRIWPVALAITVAILMMAPAFAQVPVPERIPINTPYVTLAVPFAEDFETGDGGFTAGGNDSWEHGEPTVHVTPVTGQGAGMWATNLDGDYADQRCDYVQSPVIDLTSYPPGAEGGVSTARVLFRHWYHFENRWDGGVVQASRDGVDWQVLDAFGGHDDSLISSIVRGCLGVEQGEPVYTGPSGTTPPRADLWRSAEHDLSAFLGSEVQLRWVLGSDSRLNRLGWYIDDVQVEIGAGVRAVVPVPQPPSPEQGIAFTPLNTVYAEDFEFDGGGWTVGGTADWEWGEVTSPPLPASGSLSMWGTSLAGDYGTGACSTLTSPTISLPGADPDAGDSEAARLSFLLWRHARSGYDGAVLQASDDGGASWQRLVPHDGYDRTIFSSTAAAVRDCLGVTTSDPVWSGPFSAPKDDEWTPVTADLTPYLGGDVQLRFVFASTDVLAERRGVYIDDVVIELGASATVDTSDPLGQVDLTPPGWTVEGETSWAFGVPSSGPVSTRPVWATNLAGDYTRNECGSFTSPPIDSTLVPGLGKLTLHFEHHFDSAHNYDGGIIQASSDGGVTWNVVRPDSGYSGTVYSPARTCLGDSQAYVNNPTGSGYATETADINRHDSEELRIRFVFASNSYTYDLGWYVRAIGLSRGAAVVPLSFQEPTQALPESVWEKVGGLAGERLIETLKEDPYTPQPMVVLGPDLARSESFPTRDDTISHFTASAEPFFRAVEVAAERTGAEVVRQHVFGPAVSVVADARFLAELHDMEMSRGAALNDEGSVRLVDPIEDDSFGAQNTNGRKMLQAEDLWVKGYRGEGIRISIIDTGIDGTHEAFRFADGSSRIVNFTDLVNGRSAAYDDHGHGTHVGGTAAGSALYNDTTYGYFQETGVAPAAEILGAKFLNSGGGGTLEAAIRALEWSFAEGAHITSNSWGASSCSGGVSVIAVVEELTDQGMLSVFAAGNRGASGSRTVGSPACGEAALSVGAVDDDANIAYFSSRGPCSDPYLGTPERICPDVVAKGVSVRSAIPRSGASQADPSGYKTWQGTSMATPHVAGAVALMEQMKVDMTGSGWDTAARAEEEVLKMTALDLGEPGPDDTYGWGLVQLLNVYELLNSTDVARVTSFLGVPSGVLHQGDTTRLAFSVRNMGGAYANGTFQVSLTDPNGDVAVLSQKDLALGLLDQENFATTFTVTSNVLHGTYTFRGTFAYTWTNKTSGAVHEELVDRAGSFEVKRVFFEFGIEGFPEKAAPGEVQVVDVTATNLGNDDATDVSFEFTIPDGYLFVPGATYDPTVPRSRYADPMPDEVREDKTFGRVTLIWNVDAVAMGESFSFQTQIAPTELGMQRALFVGKYADGAGNSFSQGKSATQVVGLPL